ncbi:hypothetical protein HRbin02_00316 [Candidatus Calditenuaceae archaeon HR02]|nr:hypothetical protein HRbin02_00316 [Candidatus Calditenuaceae archaeon HR02]
MFKSIGYSGLAVSPRRLYEVLLERYGSSMVSSVFASDYYIGNTRKLLCGKTGDHLKLPF